MAHIEVPRTTVQFTFPFESASTAPRVFFDALHREVIVATNEKQVFVSHRPSATLCGKQLQLPIPLEDVRGLTFSPCAQFLCLHSKHELVVMLKDTGEVVATASPSRSGATILGVYWVQKAKKGNLLLITSRAFELFQFSILGGKKRKVELKRRSSVKTDQCKCHWYLPVHEFALALDRNDKFRGVCVTPDGLLRVTSFEVKNCAQTTLSDDVVEGMSRQVTLLDLYGRVTCTFVDEVSGRMHVFALRDGKEGSKSMRHTHTLDLMGEGTFHVSAIDSVLVVHSLRNKMPLLFDVADDTSGSGLIAPLVPPLPIAVAEVCSDSGRHCNDPGDEGPVSYDDWNFLAPRFVVSLRLDERTRELTGKFLTLQLNLNCVAKSWRHRMSQEDNDAALLAFLHRRRPRTAKPLILSTMRRMVQSHALMDKRQVYVGMRSLSAAFNRVSRVCHRALVERLKLLRRLSDLQKQKNRSEGALFTTHAALRAMHHVSEYEGIDEFDSVSRVPLLAADVMPLTCPSSNSHKMSYSGMPKRTLAGELVLPQLALVTEVILPVARQVGPARVCPVVCELARSVTRARLEIGTALSHCIAQLCLQSRRFYDLHQLLQYHVLPDEATLAAVLLRRSEVYPPFLQLGLDMLRRLGRHGLACHAALGLPVEITHEKQQEEMDDIEDIDFAVCEDEDCDLVQGVVSVPRRKASVQVVTALRFSRRSATQQNYTEFPCPRVFFECARESGDPRVVLAVHEHFLAVFLALRGKAAFLPEDECDDFLELVERIKTPPPECCALPEDESDDLNDSALSTSALNDSARSESLPGQEETQDLAQTVEEDTALVEDELEEKEHVEDEPLEPAPAASGDGSDN
ncbi:MAG: hypothetical protein MHM6MM_000658 [Cercozoa sp. M6MM]